MEILKRVRFPYNSLKFAVEDLVVLEERKNNLIYTDDNGRKEIAHRQELNLLKKKHFGYECLLASGNQFALDVVKTQMLKEMKKNFMEREDIEFKRVLRYRDKIKQLKEMIGELE